MKKRALGLVVLCVLGAPAGDASASAQGTRPLVAGPADPRAASPAEIQKMFEAFALLQAQEELKLSDEQHPIKNASDAVDRVLDLRQQARFRAFEEQMERRKIDLVTRVRRNIRPRDRR